MLEHMIPAISWKKVVSKLITVLCSTVICVGVATLSVIAFILVSSHFDKSIVEAILNVFQYLFQSPAWFTLQALYIVFCFSSLYMIIFLCIAFSKSISHKNKVAAPIGIVTFVLIIATLAYLGTLVQRIPIIRFNLLGEDSLSSIVMSILVFITALLGTSWLMENKVEH